MSSRGMVPAAQGVGEVVRVFTGGGTEGKMAFTRATVVATEYNGKGRDGQARFMDRYAVLIGFGQTAESMQVLAKGDFVAYAGSPQASRAFKKKDGEYTADLEVKVDRFAKLSTGAAVPEEPVGPAEDDAETSFEDPFADE